jgi:hypothetical protein
VLNLGSTQGQRGFIGLINGLIIPGEHTERCAGKSSNIMGLDLFSLLSLQNG